MRRAKRQTLRRGNLDKGARRGVRRLLAKVAARGGAFVRPEGLWRAARRLIEAGLLCGAGCKDDWLGARTYREIFVALPAQRETVHRQYPHTMIRGRR